MAAASASYSALSSCSSSSSATTAVDAAMAGLSVAQRSNKPVFGVLVPSKGEPSLFALFDSVKSYFTADDEVLVVVNGRAHEAAVRAVVAGFEAKEQHKWALTVQVVEAETTTAAIRNQLQNAATTCPRASHLMHLHADWAFLPGILTELRRLMAAHPLQDVLLFQELGPIMDACGALLPRGNVWPSWNEEFEADRVKQASTFFIAALSKWPSEKLHSYPWVKVVVEASTPAEWCRWALESATYHTLQLKSLLLQKFGKYDAEKRYWVIDYNMQTSGGMNQVSRNQRIVCL